MANESSHNWEKLHIQFTFRVGNTNTRDSYPLPTCTTHQHYFAFNCFASLNADCQFHVFLSLLLSLSFAKSIIKKATICCKEMCHTYAWIYGWNLEDLQWIVNSPLNVTMSLKLFNTFSYYCSQGQDQGDESNQGVCAFTHVYTFVSRTYTLSAVCQHNTCRQIVIDKYTQYTKGYWEDSIKLKDRLVEIQGLPNFL